MARPNKGGGGTHQHSTDMAKQATQPPPQPTQQTMTTKAKHHQTEPRTTTAV